MARNKLSGHITALLVALALVGSTTLDAQIASAQAAPSAALSVSPPTNSLDATPGNSMTQTIGLDNISDDERVVSTEVQNFKPTGEEGQAQLTQEEGQYDLAQWITVSPSTATLAAHAHQDFKVTINVPKDAPPGGHFGAIVFSPKAGTTSSGAALSVVSQVTSLILLRVPGNATEKATVAGVNVCKTAKAATTCDKSTGFFQQGPITLTARIQNQGNVQVQPQGTITIYNMFGSKVKTLTVTGKNVLPDSIRRLDTTWKSGTLFGFYKAKFDLTYGSNPQELRTTKSFMAAPLVTIGLAVLVLLVVFMVFWLPRKRLKKAFKALAASGD